MIISSPRISRTVAADQAPELSHGFANRQASEQSLSISQSALWRIDRRDALRIG
jgi:hypothetical protein